MKKLKNIDWAKINVTLDSIINDSEFYEDFDWIDDLILNNSENRSACLTTNFSETIESYKLLLFESIKCEKYLISKKIKQVMEIEYEDTLRVNCLTIDEAEREDNFDEINFIYKLNNDLIEVFLSNLFDE